MDRVWGIGILAAMITLRKIAQASAAICSYILFDNEVAISEAAYFLDMLCIRGLSANTLRAYAFDLLAFYRFIEGLQIPLSMFSPHHAIDFVAGMRNNKIAPRTINRRIQTISAFLGELKPGVADAVFAGPAAQFYRGRKNTSLLGPSRIKRSSTGRLKVKVPRRICVPLSDEVIQKFVRKMKSFRNRSICLLMLALGLRSFEVVGLKVHDIDFNGRYLRVRGKGDKDRIMPMADWVAIPLKKYLDFERPRVSHAFCFVALKGQNWGCPLTLEGLRKIFRYRRKTDCKKANPHRFRHTFCTNLIRQGVALPIVQKLMGHESIETTLLYINLSNEDVSREYHRAMENMERDNGPDKR